VLAEIRADGPDTRSDAYELGQLTSLPATIFVGFFTVASFAAVVAGGLIVAGALR
jgi:hypothetical protein